MLARGVAVLVGLVLLADVAVVSYEYGADNRQAENAVEPSSSQRLDFLEEILGTVRDDAVAPPKEEELISGAVQGLLKALDDPYAKYYDEDAFDDLNTMLEGGFSGIGVVIEETPKGLVIVTVFEGTPAAEEGLEEGERIISVDGTPVDKHPTDVIVDRIKGEEGTEVTLGLEGGSKGKRTVTLTRARIEIPNVESRRLADGSGYIQMRQFTKGVADILRKEVERLVRKGAQGVVLDLRNNPGGLLAEAVDVGSLFIEEGTIVEVRERGNQERTYPAEGDAVDDLPLVVLVNKGSASASEIVAGAIQDADRGVLVGETTFGKGTVQTIHRLQAGGGVKYTTAQYFTPSGDSIEEVGVKPDRTVVGPGKQLAAAREELQALIAGAADGTS
jgi:carboxyl-terminal processing protease